ncbi:ABC transporter permease [Klebsiella pneumoniae]|uniref:ABC transporter permease n=1 Tax=Klebsiella pneumoniae TaxID=573 RepID=UPI001BABCFCA|nr:ABC transporter permease [Klebsiella pneumoniae]MBQ5265201.1 ABC transporter permease [Klebsiella pneumoniae]
MTMELLAIFAGSAIRLAAPLLIASTGELISERAGVLNMSVEGMMLTGAFLGAAGASLTGNAEWGLLIGVFGVIPLALLQAFLSVTLRANQIVTGIGINILVLGSTTLAYREMFGARSDAVIPSLDKWSPPLLRDIPLLGSEVFNQVWIFYLGLLVLLICAVMMRRTALGISLNAVGVAPRAVDQSGQSVARLRYGAVLFSGMMAAAAGCLISIGNIHTFTEGMTNGTGYLAIAAIIFGNWKIGRTALACLLFGAASALQFQLPLLGVQVPTALLIMLPYLLALIAVAGLIGRQTAPAALTQPYQR